MQRRVDDFRPYTADQIAFLNRGKGIDAPNLQVAVEKVFELAGKKKPVIPMRWGNTARDKFVARMNELAPSFRMENTEFVNPEGRGDNNKSTVADLVMLGCAVANSYDYIDTPFWAHHYWPNNSIHFVEGPNPRIVYARTSVPDERQDLYAHYKPIFDKTGSGNSAEGPVAVLLAAVEHPYDKTKMLVGAVHSATEDGSRFKHMKDLFDHIIDNSKPLPTASRYAGAVVDRMNERSHRRMPEPSIIVAQNETETISPWSVTKVMTYIVAYGILYDRLNDKVEFDEFDMIGGSHENWEPGDILKLSDIFTLLLSRSDNRAANLLARVAGEYLM